jgi:uncharacterized protein
MDDLLGRDYEKSSLDEALHSDHAELIAVHGRRRVGKTFLIRQHYQKSICFELVGIHGVSVDVQLRSFAESMAAADPTLKRSASKTIAPADWHQAFMQLRQLLDKRGKRRGKSKHVVFFDELPWLASRRSGFLSAFEHFWNSWASKQSQLVVVVCGSAASWMLDNVVNQRGGLHNRVTRRIRVDPFSLTETDELLRSRGVTLGWYQTIELYMALGGIPFYLVQVRRSESAAQNIDRLCFSRDGLLRNEFGNLYASLFERADRHEVVVRALARKRRGMTRAELLAVLGRGSGGAASKVLNELEQSGFVLQMAQLGNVKRDSVYWLADEYSLFYLTWIEPHRGAAAGTWMRKQGTPAWRAWSGLAFEAICQKHVAGIKHALGISGVASVEASWSVRPGDGVVDGAQIDLVIDRADRTTNLCEMKFSEQAFVVDKSYARELKHKRDTFRSVTGSKKALFVTLVTSYGIADNEHSRGIVSQSITAETLFKKP